jgi:transcriptional regulator with XRE-family HTH domain
MTGRPRPPSGSALPRAGRGCLSAELAAQLDAARCRAGLSHRLLALAVGVAPSYVGHLLRPIRRPSVSVARRLVAALDLSPDVAEALIAASRRDPAPRWPRRQRGQRREADEALAQLGAPEPERSAAAVADLRAVAAHDHRSAAGRRQRVRGVAADRAGLPRLSGDIPVTRPARSVAPQQI